MDDRDRATPSSSRTDDEGVRISGRSAAGRHAALIYKTLALVLVGGCAVYLIGTHHRDGKKPDDPGNANVPISSPQAIDAPPDASLASDVVPRRPQTLPNPAGADPVGDPTRDLSAFIPPGEEPTMADVIDELRKAGIRTGLGAFNPPGTSPPLIGLAVPEDYPLPEGYVRHSQATDDGQRIEPILMYSPDFEFFDAAGRRIAIPDDRVVPPNMAPPGLPVRLIRIPPPLPTPRPSI